MLITLKIDVVDMVRLCVVQEVAGCVLVAQDKVAGGRPVPVCTLVAQEVVGRPHVSYTLFLETRGGSC